MHTEDVELLVIGWGKGGKTLAASMGRAGHRVAVVERDAAMVGGSCINVACVPTKALIHDAQTRRPDDDPQRWFDAAVGRRDDLTAAMRATNHRLLDTVDSVLLVGGAARFVGPREVEVTGGADRMRIRAQHVVINTGSVPAMPSVPGATVAGSRARCTTCWRTAVAPRDVGGGARVPTRRATHRPGPRGRRGALGLHEALEELRDVIGVLRAGEVTPAPERPLPGAHDVWRLVAEAREAGQDVTARVELDSDLELDAVPPAVGRTAFRVVQEALTNARRHAPGEEVTVELRGGRDRGLVIEVVNTVGDPRGPAVVPAGTSTGLVGLRERTDLLGGRLSHGVRDGRFHLSVSVPWR